MVTSPRSIGSENIHRWTFVLVSMSQLIFDKTILSVVIVLSNLLELFSIFVSNSAWVEVFETFYIFLLDNKKYVVAIATSNKTIPIIIIVFFFFIWSSSL